METVSEKAKDPLRSRNAGLMFLLGLLLILPALKVGFDTRLRPALFTIQTSMTEYNMMRPAQYIGAENYTKLFQDDIFGQAMQFGMSLLLTRLFILAIVPPVVGLLAGAGNLLARSLNRIVLSVVAGLTIPVGLVMIWRIYWSQMWGTEMSPIFDQNHSLASITGARDLVMLLDGMVLLGTGAIAGILVFMAVMRGRSAARSVNRTALVVWLLVMLFGFLTLADTFLLPYILTAGGPARTTTTPALYSYQLSFTRLEIGYAAAQNTLLIIPTMLTVVIAWLIIELSRLRMTYVPSRGGSLVGLVALPLTLLMALPVVGLVMWGNNLAGSTDGYSAFSEIVANPSAYATVLTPWQTIWLVQIPFTLLAGFGLGFIRPGGRVVSSLLFLLLVVTVAMPDGLLYIGWYVSGREQGILNTTQALSIPWQISIFPLLAFKLYFDGAYEKYQQAVQDGAQPQQAVIWRVILPALPLAIVLGAVLSFQSVQDFNWSLLVMTSKDLYPLPLQLAQIIGSFGPTGATASLAGALQLIGQIAVAFIPIFAVLGVVIVDRLALISGRSSILKNEIAAAETPVL